MPDDRAPTAPAPPTTDAPAPLGAPVPAAAPVPGRSKRRRQVTIVIGLVVAVFVIGAALAALLRVTVAERGADGAIVRAGQLPSAELAPGDCFAVPDPNSNVVSIVRAQPCDDPHDLEAFHTFDSVHVGAFPGEDGFTDEAQALCLPAFRSYVGAAVDDTQLRVYTVVPSADSWATGDRRVVCAAFDPDTQLTGSVRRTGR